MLKAIEKSTNKLVGARLRKCRDGLGWSRRELAERMDIVQTTVQAHEVGRNTVNPHLLMVYAAIFKVNVEWLVTGKTQEAAAVAAAIQDPEALEAWLNTGRALGGK